MGSNKSKNYAAIKTSVTSTKAEMPWWRRSRTLLASIAAIVVVLVVVIAFLWWPSDRTGASSDQQGTKVGTAHGPRSVSDGVPTGYTQDPDGAAAAAANFLQSLGEASRGRLEVDKLKDIAVSGTPDGKLAEVLNDATGRKEIAGQPGNTYPVSITVSNFTQKNAQVTVWQTSIGLFTPPKSAITNVAVVWGTTTLTMVWNDEKGTWQAKDYAYKNGPNPYDVTTLSAEDPIVKGFRSGTYTLIVN